MKDFGAKLTDSLNDDKMEKVVNTVGAPMIALAAVVHLVIALFLFTGNTPLSGVLAVVVGSFFLYCSGIAAFVSIKVKRFSRG